MRMDLDSQFLHRTKSFTNSKLLTVCNYVIIERLRINESYLARNRQRWVDCLRAASAGSELPVQNIDNTINISEIPKSNSRIHEQLINARDSITAARQYLAEIEDYCANEPINIENLKLLSYGRSAIKALELAVDSADRTLFFGSKIEQEKR